MARGTLNLGILAHVDAGKTTLTERLLYAAGVIEAAGSVDAGTTQTDSLELERRRGITIRSAVVSFPLSDAVVNVIDTPGHPDFIAEVERALSVLDGAVLVISAVEGVQPQTRVLLRALQRLRVPSLLFVNKIDRGGADCERAYEMIRRRLTPAAVPMGAVQDAGLPTARFTAWGVDDRPFHDALTELLTTRDDALLAAYVADEASVTYPRLWAELARQTARGFVHPVYYGSAVSGAGVADLTDGMAQLLPLASGDASGQLAGRVFKIERGPAGDKVAYVRMFAGTVRIRDRVPYGGSGDRGGEKVTAIQAFEAGRWRRRDQVEAGQIAKLWGLAGVRVGDPLGAAGIAVNEHHFAPPTLATVVVPGPGTDQGALRAALAQLSEQDPLIKVRQDEAVGELAVSLYGEIQKEVIEATLAHEYGIEVSFRKTTTICVERPTRRGEAVEVFNTESNPFHATLGIRVEPAPPGSGVAFRLQVDGRTVPMYVFKNLEGFAYYLEQYVRDSLQAGRFGWRVTDCVVTVFKSGYPSSDGPPATRGPQSTSADFRKLTPLVLMQALEQAETVVCEPILAARLEVPADAVGAVLTGLSRLGATDPQPSVRNEVAVIEAEVPVGQIPELQRQLPGLTRGEGVLETRFGGYQPR